MKPGVYRMKAEEYHADPTPDPSLSRSTIKELIFGCPAKARFNNPRLNSDFVEDDGDGKFDIGEATHALFLEGVNVAEVIDAKDWKTKAAQEARDSARDNGKVPLLPHQFAKVSDMVKAAHIQLAECEELEITDLHAQGDSELSYFWKEKGGVWCRIRPDWISKDRSLVIDYKTTKASADPMTFHNIITGQGYDIQDAFYSRGIAAIDGREPRFIFMVQEDRPPYLCSFIALPPEFAEMGLAKAEYGIALWRKCLKENKWPGYPQKVCWIDPPAYALAAWEARAAMIGASK